MGLLNHQESSHSVIIQITLLENQCPICREICNSRQVLTEHLRSHEDDSQLQLSTHDDTQNLLTERRGITAHEQIDTSSTPFRCDLCDASFKNKLELISHTSIQE
ncbi:Zinc finger, C2H2 type [Popillia japonica]|uniref:Zinc finger, C2H2 type n=1 Tax=Popillia japonica TaxID=7064 RepID=A0AAW1LH39_POPJA